jgi:hypothetical protein
MTHNQDLTPYAIGQIDEMQGECCAQCARPFDRHEQAYLCERTELVYCSPQCAAQHGDGLPDGLHLATRLCHCHDGMEPWNCDCGEPTISNAGFVLAFDESYDHINRHYYMRWVWIATIDVRSTDNGSHALQQWWRTSEGRAESDQCRPVVVAMASLAYEFGGEV